MRWRKVTARTRKYRKFLNVYRGQRHIAFPINLIQTTNDMNPTPSREKSGTLAKKKFQINNQASLVLQACSIHQILVSDLSFLAKIS